MSRYQRILDLSSFGKEKLEILHKSKVIVIGAGGVGQHVLTYLVTNGILDITLVDFDNVELSNLNRQFLLPEGTVGAPKADAVQFALQLRNSDAKIKAKNLKVDESNIDELIKGYDVVVDAVDNWETKLVIFNAKKDDKQLFLHVGVDGESGQYCLFKNKTLTDVVDTSIKNSPKDGVLGPMVGAVSSLATLHLIRYLVGLTDECDTLFSFDATTNQITKIKIK